MRRRLVGLYAIVLAASFIGGCSKSSNGTNPTGPGTTTAPHLATPTFTGPNTTSDSLGAIEAKSLSATMNFQVAFAESFQTGQAKQNGSTWSWTYHSSTSSFTATWSAVKQSDGSYSWSLVFNGQTDSVTYNNWTFLKGTTSSDGKSGNCTIYYSNTSSIGIQFNWTTASNGTVTGTVLVYNASGAVTEKVVITNNTDKSGEVDVYTGAQMTFKATWQSNGSGQWWEYDPSSGAQVYYGTWS